VPVEGDPPPAALPPYPQQQPPPPPPAPAESGPPFSIDAAHPPARGRPLLPIIAGVLAGAIVVAGVAAFLLTRGGSSNAGLPSGSVAYHDPGGYFSATFEGTPLYHDTTQSTPEGPLPYKYAEYAANGVDESIGVLILPAGSSFDLNKGLQGVATGVGGDVVSSSATSFQGYQSLFGVISLSSGYLDTEVIDAGQDIYIFGTVGQNTPPPDYSAFAGSVHLTPH
jgi:hypothetical protein